MRVRVPSAGGRGDGVRQVTFHVGYVVYGVSHIGLLNHRDGYAQLRRCLADQVGEAPEGTQ
jgi:hypothetical protein